MKNSIHLFKIYRKNSNFLNFKKHFGVHITQHSDNKGMILFFEIALNKTLGTFFIIRIFKTMIFLRKIFGKKKKTKYN